MIKVFLVEDEYIVREGIKNNVDWKAFGFEFCGEASDGELAFPKIRELRPDIVITDIRMPFMDGLELSRLIRKELPKTEIMILSGFEEFEYAKEAIRLGVSAYLTKPVSGDELLKAAQRLANRIKEREQENEILARYEHEMGENLGAEKRKLFGNLVTGSISATELIEDADKLGIDLSAQNYEIVLLLLSSTTHAPEEYSDRLVVIDEEWRKLDELHGLIVFDRNFEGKALLFTGESPEEIDTRREAYLAAFIDILKAHRHIRYFGACGIKVNRLSAVKDSFESASGAFARRFVTDESIILSENDRGTGSHTETEQNDKFDIKSINPKTIDRAKLLEFLKIGEEDEIGYFIGEYFRNIGQSAMESTLFRQYLAMDVYFAAEEFISNLSVKADSLPAPDATLGIFGGAEQTKQYIHDVMQRAITARGLAANDRYSGIVNEAISYIEENYADEDLSLNSIAAHVNFSPSYLSMVFSQATGDTLIHYLTEIRMNKAKELLKCTGKKSSIIAAEVGYRDPHYFSYLFRKTQGVTPTVYRENGSDEE